MKIEVNSPNVNLPLVDRTGKRQSPDGLSGQVTGSEDRTTLHSDSASVQSLTSQALKSPEIRQDKVSALQQSLHSGNYKLDSATIASAIADNKGQ